MNSHIPTNLETQEYLIFELSNEYYGVKINTLDKLIPIPVIRHVPNLPKYIRGIIDFEEQIVPIINLKHRMKLKENSTREEFILLFEHEDGLIGVLADSIFEIKDTDVEPKKEFTYVSEHVHPFSDGTIRMKDNFFRNTDESTEEELVIVLNIKKICEVLKREMVDNGDI